MFEGSIVLFWLEIPVIDAAGVDIMCVMGSSISIHY
jgi:hypothetical protein